MTIEEQLKQVPIFSQLPAETVPTLVEQGQVLTFDAEEIVFWEGDASDAMYVILDGAVRVFKRDEAGNEFDINEQGAGECFGELALLDSQPRSASIACLTPCRFFKLEKAEFMHLLVTPETQSAAFSVLSLLVERVRVITEKYFDEQLAQRTLYAQMEVARHRSLAQMVTGVAHELNTPLGITNTAVEMIARRVQNEKLLRVAAGDPAAQALLQEMQTASELALRNIERVDKLVDDFKKISVNQLTDALETVQLPVLIDKIVVLFSLNTQPAQMEIAVHNHLPEEKTEWVGFPTYLTQVLTNLLFNIERYAYPQQEGGPIHITLAANGAANAAANAADEATEPATFIVTVQDFGVGISEANQEKIFDPFFTTGRIQGGSGLGLAIVHSLVTGPLAGEIAVESTLGEGTSFIVTFPQRIH